MAEKIYVLEKSVVYREAGQETIVIQVDKGHFYYYSKATKSFLDFFKSPRALSDLTDVLSQSEEDIEKLCADLAEKKILAKAEATVGSSTTNVSLELPKFLRKGEKTLDQIAFLTG